jgi:hypothetical protein
MQHRKKKTKDAPKAKTDWGNWLLLGAILILGLISLHHGLTGQGQYDKKHMHFYSAEEELGIGIVCLAGCTYMLVVMLRRPKKDEVLNAHAVDPTPCPPRGRLAATLAQPGHKRHPVFDFFVPRYNTLSLFLMSIAFLLLYFINPELNAFAYRCLIEEFDPKLFPFYTLFFLFIAGITFSIFHVFMRGQQSDDEKSVMLYFAVMVNGLSGLLAGARLLQTSHGYLSVFPLWNILNSLLLLLLYWIQQLDESAIIEGKAPPRQILVGGLTVLVVFLLCQFAFHLHWTLTFSVCVCYATNVNSFQQRFAVKPRELTVAPDSARACPKNAEEKKPQPALGLAAPETSETKNVDVH